MGSSGGGGSSDPSALYKTAAPMGDLPIAGKDSTIGNPFEYGQFQSFLPEIKAEGQNDMATGLRPDMFKYRSPTGVAAENGAGGDSGSGGADAMRNVLAALTSGAAGGGAGGDNPMMGGGGNPMMGGGPGLNPNRIGGPGGADMGQLHPAHNQPGVAGQTAFAPWAGNNIRAGGNMPIDWRTKEGAQPLIDQPKIGM
jgi:hypothetical protein